MLALKIKEGKKVNLYLNGMLIGSVIVIENRGSYTRVGFEFDQDIKIVREEVDERLEENPQ